MLFALHSERYPWITSKVQLISSRELLEIDPSYIIRVRERTNQRNEQSGDNIMNHQKDGILIKISTTDTASCDRMTPLGTQPNGHTMCDP